MDAVGRGEHVFGRDQNPSAAGVNLHHCVKGELGRSVQVGYGEALVQTENGSSGSTWSNGFESFLNFFSPELTLRLWEEEETQNTGNYTAFCVDNKS